MCLMARASLMTTLDHISRSVGGELHGRIIRTDIAFMSSIKDEILEVISRLNGFGFDTSHLEGSLETLFARANDNDKTRSLSFETSEDFARRLKENKVHLA